MGVDIKVIVGGGGAVAGGFPPKAHVLVAEAGSYGVQGFPAGLEKEPAGDGVRLSDSVVVTLVRHGGDALAEDWRKATFVAFLAALGFEPSLLDWLLSPHGAALATWLGLIYMLVRDR